MKFTLILVVIINQTIANLFHFQFEPVGQKSTVWSITDLKGPTKVRNVHCRKFLLYLPVTEKFCRESCDSFNAAGAVHSFYKNDIKQVEFP